MTEASTSNNHSKYLTKNRIRSIPRLPLEGALDLTYRCNNNCRHCWVRISSDAEEMPKELSFDEIRGIVDQARLLGTRKWKISGGEPMLRPDFPEIFDYITRKSLTYSINTNGTLISPKIAALLKRKGIKMVALYGATAAVHDRITRNPGSFESTLRGMTYLREASAGFIVQLVPMRDNYHQWKSMMKLAQSFSPDWRCGASWLVLSPHNIPAERNAEIISQRLSPAEVVALNPPDPSYEERLKELDSRTPVDCIREDNGSDRLFANCIQNRRELHIDPYGRMTFCCYIKDPSLRYDLRSGTVEEAWDRFIPSLSDSVHGDEEWRQNCGSCERRSDCRWCAVYGYLETGSYSAPVPYLCQLAAETRRCKQTWATDHRRYFEIAGITIRVESTISLNQVGFDKALMPFEIRAPGEDMITLKHVFGLPDIAGKDLGVLIHRGVPWSIYRKGDSFIYVGASRALSKTKPNRVAVFDADFTRGTIYSSHRQEKTILRRGFSTLTLFPTDQILLAQLLAERCGCYIHAAGAIMHGQGLLFAGRSGAGKSTISLLLKDHAEILCDDRIIVRHWPKGLKIHGTWSHGDMPDVSPNSAPLNAVLFLEKSTDNHLQVLNDGKAIIRRLFQCLIRPLVTREWWERSMELVEQISREVPCYVIHFANNRKIISVLEELVRR